MDNNIGAKLRILRKAKGLTTQEVANKVNVSQSYISRFENGRAIPDIDMLEKVLTALETNLATFFSEDFDDPSEDFIQLMDTVKTLSPKARIKLNEFLKLMKDESV
ncbi:helix-turn-helix domain-containing protein [Pseudogracilibacillus sp. SO30301A]|uniref:helix-turn-helix domain-containing protein n=1 Tax=Pseudogracilibacillus sp. SO30301A TaxID=3098291 RepID=UPI00300E1F52